MLMGTEGHHETVPHIRKRVEQRLLRIVPLYVDLDNGLQFVKAYDKDLTASERIAVRIAAAALGLSLLKVKELNGATLCGLVVKKVLTAIALKK